MYGRVKAEINLQAKSLKTYREKFSPRAALRVSMPDYKAENGFVNMPLYGVEIVGGKLSDFLFNKV